MKPFPNRSSLPTSLLLLIILSCNHASCEKDTTVSITDSQNPPTFKLDGNGNQLFFLVMEISPSRKPDEDVVLWKILPAESTRNEVWLWPQITYGKVPDGFVQEGSQRSVPPLLVEGKVYSAGGPAENANGGSIWFTIREGHAVEIPKPRDR